MEGNSDSMRMSRWPRRRTEGAGGPKIDLCFKRKSSLKLSWQEFWTFEKSSWMELVGGEFWQK